MVIVFEYRQEKMLREQSAGGAMLPEEAAWLSHSFLGSIGWILLWTNKRSSGGMNAESYFAIAVGRKTQISEKA